MKAETTVHSRRKNSVEVITDALARRNALTRQTAGPKVWRSRR